MKETLIFLWILASISETLSLTAQNPISKTFTNHKEGIDFVGIWFRGDPDSIDLRINYLSDEEFEFRMTSFNPHYYGYMGEDAITNKKIAKIEGNSAFFNDSAGICDGRSLYYEGEEPCKLTFELITPQVMKITEEDCRYIYGGDGVTWGGWYKKLDSQKFHITNVVH